MIPTVAWMRQKFAEYNSKYFANKLPVPEFRVARMKDRFGNYFLDGKVDDQTRRVVSVVDNGTLSLTSHYSRNENDVISTMLHEMVHEYLYLVLRICPKDRHGREFRQVGRNIEADGWNLGADGVELVDSDVETNENGATGSCILLVIKATARNDYKWWICRADENNIDAFSKVVNGIDGLDGFGFYQCQSACLEHVKSDPSTLFGWGGKTYQEAVGKLSKYCGESPQLFYGKNLKKIR